MGNGQYDYSKCNGCASCTGEVSHQRSPHRQSVGVCGRPVRLGTAFRHYLQLARVFLSARSGDHLSRPDRVRAARPGCARHRDRGGRHHRLRPILRRVRGPGRGVSLRPLRRQIRPPYAVPEIRRPAARGGHRARVLEPDQRHQLGERGVPVRHRDRLLHRPHVLLHAVQRAHRRTRPRLQAATHHLHRHLLHLGGRHGHRVRGAGDLGRVRADDGPHHRHPRDLHHHGRRGVRVHAGAAAGHPREGLRQLPSHLRIDHRIPEADVRRRRIPQVRMLRRGLLGGHHHLPDRSAVLRDQPAQAAGNHHDHLLRAHDRRLCAVLSAGQYSGQ